MRQFRAFVTTFIISFSVMLCGFMALYWVVQYSPTAPVGENQSGVPLLTPDYNDSKTTLLILDSETADFFFLIKLNALQNKVNVISVPGSFHLSSAGRSLSESMAYAGAMQCVQDLGENFDIKIDYHLVCGQDSLEKVISSFSPLRKDSLNSTPLSVQQYILRNSDIIDTSSLVASVYSYAAVLDNSTGIAFLNNAATVLLQDNLHNLHNYAIDSIKDNFSRITTNMNTADFDRLKRIISFLTSKQAVFEAAVIEDTDTAQQTVDKILKE